LRLLSPSKKRVNIRISIILTLSLLEFFWMLQRFPRASADRFPKTFVLAYLAFNLPRGPFPFLYLPLSPLSLCFPIRFNILSSMLCIYQLKRAAIFESHFKPASTLIWTEHPLAQWCPETGTCLESLRLLLMSNQRLSV
jgi:hypothetical protein